jgi:hypothetical protein
MTSLQGLGALFSVKITCNPRVKTRSYELARGLDSAH